MSIPVPLSVRLATARGDRHVTKDLRDLRFREVATGGWASASMSLDRPLTVDPLEFEYYSRCYVYDTRNGSVVWEGRIEDPGRGNRPDGQVWQLTAIGPSGHAHDRTVPLIYVDGRLTAWEPADKNTPGAKEQVSANPGGTSSADEQAILMQFPQGLALVTNSRAVMRYWPIHRAGQKLARYDYTWDAGVTSGDYQIQGVTRTAGSGGENSRAENWNTAGGASSAKVVVTDFPDGRNTVEVRGIRTGGATTVADDVTWCVAIDPVVFVFLNDAAGTEKTTSYTTNTVLASEVVADLLGRLLTSYDGSNASIATTSYAIAQLAYPDGIMPAQVLDDLMLLEPDYRWGTYESNSAGKHRFEWAAWPSTVRYEADVADGFDSPGSGDGLYNAARVRWVDNKGAIRTNRRTSTVDELTAASLTREAFIDLGDDIASSAEANRVGDQFLAQHAHPPNAGRLAVARPIRDLSTGRMVMPWEIKAGELIRVRGVLPRVDALNPTARDGVTIFRIWTKEYSASQAAATLELDSSHMSTAQMLADLARNRITRRR